MSVEREDQADPEDRGGKPPPETGLSDTSPKIRRVMVERLRAMSHAEKFERMRDLSRMVEALAREGIRARHPDADEREINLRLASRRLPADLMKKAFGWDVEEKGY